MIETDFWRHKALSAMSHEEWEALCDGCGKCCLNKLEDNDSGQVYYTNVACRLLDLDTCRCRHYTRRHYLVRDCVELTPEITSQLDWLPRTCAYRLIAEGKPLAWWHPLVCGDPHTIHSAGMSVRRRAISEREAGDLEDHIVDWPE